MRAISFATNPKEADGIVSSGKYASKGVPAGTIVAAVDANRLIYDVRPSWDATANKATLDDARRRPQKWLDPSTSRADGYPELGSVSWGLVSALAQDSPEAAVDRTKWVEFVTFEDRTSFRRRRS